MNLTLAPGLPGGSDGKESAAMQETLVWFLSWQDPLEKGMATHSSILAWRIPQTESCCQVMSPSHVQLFATPWTAAHKASLVPHHLPEFSQVHVHWISDAIQPPHPLLPPSLLTLNLPQHQGLFQWVSCLHQVAKVLEPQLQHQSFQWIFRVDFF